MVSQSRKTTKIAVRIVASNAGIIGGVVAGSLTFGRRPGGG
jgi:hypothetical protein